MRIGLISDTHGELRAEVFSHFDGVDLILHAGDVGDPNILVELRTIAPVHAVVGNTDEYPLTNQLPEVQTLELAGYLVVMTHGHKVGARPDKLRAAFPDANVIVYGHTHVPLVDRQECSLVVNPGAAGPARFKLTPTVGILELLPEASSVRLIDL